MSTRRGSGRWLRRFGKIRDRGDGMAEPPPVTLYTRPGCSLCGEARKVLLEVRGEIPFPYREVDISDDPALRSRFGTEIPVVFVGGRKLFKYRVDAARLRRALRARSRT